MNCKIAILKYIALTLNVLCGIAAVLIVAMNGYQLIFYTEMDIMYTQWLADLILGCVLFFISLVHCCGIFYNGIYMLWLYVVTIFVLLIGEIIILFMMPSNQELADNVITNSWNSELIESRNMASYEIQLQCCGKLGPKDYENYGQAIPPTCFASLNSNITEHLNSEGCITKLHKYLNTYSNLQTIYNCSSLSLKIFSMLTTIFLAISLKHDKRRKSYRYM